MSLSISKEFKDNLEYIKDSYSHNIPIEDSKYFQLITSPFKVLKLKSVLSSINYRKELKQAVEQLSLNKKDNDLYSLWQSDDLNSSKLKPIKKFIHILEKELGIILSEICGVKLNGKISVTASFYKNEDVLLCHDDKCEDRCIAFVYYLTGSESCGGSFDMFAHDENMQPTEVVYRIPPEENTLICFEVGNLTYHQVSEITDETFKRWSINGWFHSDRKLSLMNYEEQLPSLQEQKVLEGLVLLDQYINLVYCTPSTLMDMQQEFEGNSFLLLKDLFLADFYKSCSEELSRTELTWKKVGPANRRNYYSADLNQLPESLNKLVGLLGSPIFISYLKNITGLSLQPKQGLQASSKYILELIKWSPGCYTMATDNDEFFKTPGVDLYFFFCTNSYLSSLSNSSGYITYLDSGDDAESCDGMDDKELITILPEDNAIALVYRTEMTVRFTKYINHSVNEYYAIYATYYEADSDS